MARILSCRSCQIAVEELAKTPPDNQAAVGSIEGTVGDLEAALNDNLCADAVDPAQCGQSLTDLIDVLVGIAEQIATDALDQAVGCDPGHPDLNDAQQALADGDILRASGAFKDAVSTYKDALAKAEGVLSYCP